MAAHVQETVTNVVDAERGLVHQQRNVLVKAPRRDGGVDVLLARTFKTVRLPTILQRPDYPEVRRPLLTSIEDGHKEDEPKEEETCCSCLSCLCTVCCLLSCLPCNDRACFSLWQIVTWIGLLSLIPLTAYGPIQCSPLHSTSITAVILLASIAILSSICFLYHCCCTKPNRGLERCVLSFCAFLFVTVFIITVVLGSYYIFQVPGNFDVIINSKYNTTTNGTISYIDCHLTGLPLITIILSYMAIVIYIGLCMGCCYTTFRSQ